MTTGGLQYAMSIIDKNFGVGIGKAKKETEGLDKATNKANTDVKKLGDDGQKSMTGLGDSVKKVGGAMAGIFAINKLIDFGGHIAEVTDKAEKLTTQFGLNFGSAGAKNLEMVDKRAKDLNLSVESNRTGFIAMSTAMNGTKIQGKNLTDIFDGVAVASSVMKLSGKDNEAMLESFGTVAKKRLVDFAGFQSEFGSKIPGALKIAADSMGVTENKLKQMMEKGEVSADNFLPKFANQIKSTFQEGLPAAANSMQAAMNKKENALTGFWEKASSLFGPGVAELIGAGAGFIDWFGDFMVTLEPVGVAIWGIILAVQPLWDSLGGLVGQFGTLEGTTGGLTTVLNGAAFIVEALAGGIGFFIDIIAPLAPYLVGLVGVVWALNFAMAANPTMAVIIAIIALIGVIKMAYEKVGWFRGSIMAAWEAIKGFAGAIKDYVINRFKDMLTGITGIGKAILLFFQGDWKGAFEAGKKATGDLMGVDSKMKLIKDLKETGINAGKAYHKGVGEAAANNLKEKTAKEAQPKLDANGKFFDNYAAKTKSDGSIIPGADDKKKKSLSGSGSDTKHVTFNIQSFVKEMTIQTNALGSAPSDIKREMQKIFNEIIADLEVRVNA
ncbi:tape measure protein [Flavobacterium algoritolerans]|uniref:Tape measure protein n=1 Tax=Flavobacterium algoritolerans TaxID=3041254 RepID=A0ABT6V915_9FLAO|nr:tape measure protein [Flavobacterium algoritolerans]MDI5894386.1 tape measure protein [Flavobacterium algoritolerans]